MTTVEIFDMRDGVFLSLQEILHPIADIGRQFDWELLHLWAMGLSSFGSVPDLEADLKNAPKNLDWRELERLAEEAYQIIEITLLGRSSSADARSISDEEEMRIEAIDSTCWRVAATDPAIIDRYTAKFSDVRRSQ